MERRDHLVSSYEEELSDIKIKIVKMGGLAEQVVAQSLEAMEKRDRSMAEDAIKLDELIDILQREVEDEAIVLIVKRQPVASDLRQVIAALRISANLERVGDLGKNIAKRTFAVGTDFPPKQLMLGLRHMGEVTLVQLKDVLDAFMERDADQAIKVWLKDESLDDLYNSIFRELLTYMMEDPINIRLCAHLLFGAKNLERIGDHTTNIAETIYFLVHGRTINSRRPKRDVTSTTVVVMPT
jgi:phosphate transport system protein